MLTTLTDTLPESLCALRSEMLRRCTESIVLLVTQGSQYDHLIARQVSNCGIFCLVIDPTKIMSNDVARIAPKGIIISGGPASVHAEPPPFDYRIFDLGIPVLGICLGAQMIAKHLGISVERATKQEFGLEKLHLRRGGGLLGGCAEGTQVLQSHGDIIVPTTRVGFEVLATTRNSPVAAFRYKHLVGVQFHPEVSDTAEGPRMFENFCRGFCGIKDSFPARNVAEHKIGGLREAIRDQKVLVALSGGSDSSTVAYLLRIAVGGDRSRLKGLYIKGLDRPDDEADFLRFFGNQSWIQVEVIDATEIFLSHLAGKITALEKRRVFKIPYSILLDQKAQEFGASFIAQGTLYTDLVESGYGHATGARRATIKEHHNTGLIFSVPELKPFADCVKDNARDIGREIGVPEELLIRHPFPGPGLTVRIEGEVTAKKLRIARAADQILMEEIRQAHLYEKIWQAGARVLSSLHTTTKGDDAGTGYIIQCFAISSVNGFTARPYQLPWDVLDRIASRMGSEIPEVGATDFRISGKPYSTIEGE